MILVRTQSALIALAALFAATCFAAAARAQDAPDSLRAGAPRAHGADDAGTRSARDAAVALSLREATALAIERNPALLTFPWEMRAAEARALQAGARSNPELSLELENFSGTLPAVSQSEATLSLGQLIELGGKRSARRDAALAERDVVERDFEAARLAVMAQVAQRFVAVLGADALAVVAAQEVSTARETAAAVKRRVDAGASTAAELTRAEVDVSLALLDEQLRDQERSLSRVRLASLWGATEPAFESVSGSLDSAGAVPALETLLERAENGPAITRWERELAAREAALGAERAATGLDLALAGGVRHHRETDDYSLVAGLSVPLRISDRNQGAVHAAEAAIEQARAAREFSLSEFRQEIIRSYGDLTQAQREVTTLRDAVLPGAEKAYREIEQGYRQGRLSYLDLLEARRTWNAARRDHIEALIFFHSTTADLERLVGGPLDASAGVRNGGLE